MGIVIIILIFIIIIAASIALGKVKNRAMQTVLKDTPFSDSAINKTTQNILGKKATKKFLEEHGNKYTEESINTYLMEIGQHLINKDSMDVFSQKVTDKMMNDAKLSKLQQAQFSRVCIISYARNVLTWFVVGNDGKDEYQITVWANVDESGIRSIKEYRVQKGVAVGF